MDRRIILMAALVAACGAGACGRDNHPPSVVEPEEAPPAGPTVVSLTWDAEDTGLARWIPSEGRVGYEVCWSTWAEAFTWEFDAQNPLAHSLRCVDIPDTQRADVEFPDGRWFAAVRAVYVDADRGTWKTKFSNVIQITTRPQIAIPIEDLP